MPKAGTNPRGVEFSKQAMEFMLRHSLTKNIPIEWKQSTLDYKIYERWVEEWAKLEELS